MSLLIPTDRKKEFDELSIAQRHARLISETLQGGKAMELALIPHITEVARMADEVVRAFATMETGLGAVRFDIPLADGCRAEVLLKGKDAGRHIKRFASVFVKIAEEYAAVQSPDSQQSSDSSVAA